MNHSVMGWAEGINWVKNLAIVHGRVRDDTKGGWEKRKAMHKHPVSPTGALLFFDLFKVRKITYDLFKVRKMITMFFNLLKVSKMTISYDLFKVSCA